MIKKILFIAFLTLGKSGCLNATCNDVFSEKNTSPFDFAPLFDWTTPTYLEALDLNLLLDASSFTLLNGPEPIVPYAPGEFTKISKEQVDYCKFLSVHPKWGGENPAVINKYYNLHEESQLDRNMRYLATQLMGAIIHGSLTQDELAPHLRQFDIRKLLNEGPQTGLHLSLQAQQLLFNSLHKMPQVIDIHLHNLGYDEGNFQHPRISSQKEAKIGDYFTFTSLRYAAGMSTVMGATHEARKRLHMYAAHFPKLRGMLLPIHKAILPSGLVDWESTGSFLKNHSALLTSLSFDNPYHDSYLLPAVSVHPFDPNWKKKLYAAHAKGIRLVKWMPPQSIPPDSDQLNNYYRVMRHLKMTLIAHSGMEHTIPTTQSNAQWADWGNPLRFRKPLKMGVNVILAHCGHKDCLDDHDAPSDCQKPGYELFIRLAREAHQKNLTGEWKGLLYGDLAAVTTHYGPAFIREILKVSDEEGIRLIYGSDYPFTNLVQPTSDGYDLCAKAGLLNPDHVSALKEIRQWNPLLANYVFTRNLELKRESGETVRFQESTFTGKFKNAELVLFDQIKWNRFKNRSTGK